MDYDDATDSAAAGTMLLCIEVAPDGSMSTYTSKDGEESARRPAADIGEALKALLDAHKASAAGTDEQQFAAGFSDPDAAPGRMTQGKLSPTTDARRMEMMR